MRLWRRLMGVSEIFLTLAPIRWGCTFAGSYPYPGGDDFERQGSDILKTDDKTFSRAAAGTIKPLGR
jgi:hypothetical protein